MAEVIQQDDDIRDLNTPADGTEPSPDAVQNGREPAPEARDEPKGPKVGGKFDEARERIYAKARALREASDGAPDIDVISQQQKNMYGNVETESDRRRPAEEPPAAEVDAADIPPLRKYKLNVNGREVEVDEDQVKAKAQIALASEQVLEQAKIARAEAQRELEEIRRLRADHSASPQSQPAPAKAQAEDTKPATDAELDKIIEAIQVGDQKDAAAALAKYGDQIEQRALAKVGNLEERVANTLARFEEDARVKAASEKALADFRTEFTEFENSEMRQRVLFDTTAEVMTEKLFEAGLKPETLIQYAETYGLAPQAAVSAAYRRLRSQGFALPDPAEVLREAGSRVITELGIPRAAKQDVKPAGADATQAVAERAERKQAMSPQPRRASILPQGEPSAPTLTKEQKDLRAVQQMRAFRRGR